MSGVRLKWEEFLKGINMDSSKYEAIIENDKPFIFGGAGIFETANRYINYEVQDEAVLHWLRQDIAELIKEEYEIVEEQSTLVLPLNSSAIVELSKLTTLECVEETKVSEQSPEYKYAKRVDTDELHCLEGSIRLILRDVRKLSRRQLTTLQFVYMAMEEILSKDIKSEKEQLLEDRVELLFMETKRITNCTNPTTVSPKWSWDRKSFIARSMMDPELIRELVRIPTHNKDEKLNTMLKLAVDVLATAASNAGNKDKVYKYILNTIMKVIEIK
jgi:hypothetical protein